MVLSLNRLALTDMGESILDENIKATYKQGWQFLAGWTTLLMSGAFAYFSIMGKFAEANKTDAIQDIRLDAVKRDIEIQTLQIKDLNERYNELSAKYSQLTK